jgi:hypothetical protein
MATVKKKAEPIQWQQQNESWEIRHGSMRVTVHKYLGHGDQLFVSCFDVGIDKARLNAKDWKEARTEALRYVEAYITELSEIAKHLCIHAQEP